MILLRASKSPALIERVLDKLFGDGPRRLVAKLIMDGDESIASGNVPEEVRSAFPTNFHISRKSSFSAMISDVRSTLAEFLDDNDNIAEIASELNMPIEEAREACRRLIK